MKKLLFAVVLLLAYAVAAQAYVVSPINVEEVWSYQKTITYQTVPASVCLPMVPCFGWPNYHYYPYTYPYMYPWGYYNHYIYPYWTGYWHIF